MAQATRKLKSALSRKETDETSGDIIDYVDLKLLPQFAILNQQVMSITQASSWWERYGVDLVIHSLAFLAWFGSHYLLASSSPVVFLAGIALLGFAHSAIAVKAAHTAVHNALCASPTWNRICGFLLSDVIGFFSSDLGYDIHIRCHHPHTNIIGLGDSSTWRAPIVPRFVYMFVTPLLVPILAPIVSIKELLPGSPWRIVRYVILAGAGFVLHMYLLLTVSQLTVPMALLVILVSRQILAIPYIHVNIFQHIGLPMYSQQHRPKKIYQMTTAVLNLPRNPILDYAFGHGIISCHTEHHLFPRLSDNMCLKIRPVVKKFCQEHDLPYHEDSYTGRVWHFLVHYDKLMVDAPPITKFVGLQ